MNFPRYIALVYSHISRDLDLFIILKWTEDLTAYAVNIGLPWIESDLCFIISSITPSALHFTVVRPFVLGQYLKVASMSYSRGRLSSLLRSCVGLPHPVDDESVASVGDVGPPPVVRPVEVVERVAVRALAVPSHPPTVISSNIWLLAALSYKAWVRDSPVLLNHRLPVVSVSCPARHDCVVVVGAAAVEGIVVAVVISAAAANPIAIAVELRLPVAGVVAAGDAGASVGVGRAPVVGGSVAVGIWASEG